MFIHTTQIKKLKFKDQQETDSEKSSREAGQIRNRNGNNVKISAQKAEKKEKKQLVFEVKEKTNEKRRRVKRKKRRRNVKSKIYTKIKTVRLAARKNYPCHEGKKLQQKQASARNRDAKVARHELAAPSCESRSKEDG
jgi:hypothetical protein